MDTIIKPSDSRAGASAAPAIKDILVQIDAGAANAARLDVAVDLAKRHGAHVTGLCIFDLRLAPGAGYGTLNVEDTLGLMKWQEQLREEALARAGALKAAFDERLRRDQVPGEWRLEESDAAATMSLHARYADIAVLGQHDPDDKRVTAWTHVLEAVLLGSGRPVLVCPYAGRFETVGKRVLIGWNAGREAARAVHDALPLMQGAESVTVLAIDPISDASGHGEEPAADITRHLARHGLPVTARRVRSDGLPAVDTLLNFAADLGSDLIVVGGYGHPRVREMVLGGVTRSLLRQSTVPVLMSH